MRAPDSAPVLRSTRTRRLVVPLLPDLDALLAVRLERHVRDVRRLLLHRAPVRSPCGFTLRFRGHLLDDNAPVVRRTLTAPRLPLCSRR